MSCPGGSDSKESAYNAGDLGWEDPLEGYMATCSSILAWRTLTDRGAWWATVHGVAALDTTEHPTHNSHTHRKVLAEVILGKWE